MLGDEYVLGLDCVAGMFLGCVIVVVLSVVGDGGLLENECVLGLDCVAGVFLGCVVVVVLAVVGTFIF